MFKFVIGIFLFFSLLGIVLASAAQKTLESTLEFCPSDDVTKDWTFTNSNGSAVTSWDTMSVEEARDTLVINADTQLKGDICGAECAWNYADDLTDDQMREPV